jgi:hypothetical protein
MSQNTPPIKTLLWKYGLLFFVGLVLIGFMGLFQKTWEFQTGKVAAEVRSNPYWVLEKWVTPQVRVHKSIQRDTKAPLQESVFLWDYRGASPQTQDSMQKWVHQGAHLILMVPSNQELPKWILDLGIRSHASQQIASFFDNDSQPDSTDSNSADSLTNMDSSETADRGSTDSIQDLNALVDTIKSLGYDSCYNSHRWVYWNGPQSDSLRLAVQLEDLGYFYSVQDSLDTLSLDSQQARPQIPKLDTLWKPLILGYGKDPMPAHCKDSTFVPYAGSPEAIEDSADTSSREWLPALQVKVGAGKLTLLAATPIWQNEDIFEADHGEFFLQLLQNKKHLYLWTDVDLPSLREIILARMPEILLLCLICLMLYLWRKGSRFGPARGIKFQTNRALKHQLESHGQFLWEHQAAPQLTAITGQILQKMLSSHPIWSYRRSELALHLGWSEDRLQRTLLALPTDAAMHQELFVKHSADQRQLYLFLTRKAFASPSPAPENPHGK